MITTNARIIATTDVSPTAREVTLVPETPLHFEAGAFVNVFVSVDGVEKRRAFSFSSDPSYQDAFSLTIRHVPTGEVSPFFWRDDVIGQEVRVMGPLGRNTADKLAKERAVLFAFGIGVSVIKSLTHRLLARHDLRSLTVVTGNRSEDEVLYRRYFESLAANDPRVTFRAVVSCPVDAAQCACIGYVHDHIDDISCTDADVYLCGPVPACDALKEKLAQQGVALSMCFTEAF